MEDNLQSRNRLQDSGNGRVLVVGDDEVGRAILLRILSGRGYVVESLGDPRNTVAKLAVVDYGLVIIDIIGYEDDPLRLLQDVRCKYPALGMVVLADPRGMFSMGDELRGLSDKLLVSPLDPDDLLGALSVLLPSGVSADKNLSADGQTAGGTSVASGEAAAVKRPGEPQAAITESVLVRPVATELSGHSRLVSAAGSGGGFSRNVIAVGGGKGGVGKSIVTANLGAGLSEMGKKVIVVDLDLGGHNLHTYFGIRKLDCGLFDFLQNEDVHLKDVVSPTSIDGLQIIGVTDDYPDAANIKYKRKVRLVDSLKGLDADYILLDLGAGTDFNVTDFFSITGGGIIVSSTEITSILNTYSFIKSVFYREMAKYFLVNGKSDLLEAAKREAKDESNSGVRSIDDLEKELVKIDPDAKEILRLLKGTIKAKLIVNMTKKGADARIGDSIKDIVKRYLDIDLDFIGSVSRDSAVEASVAAMRPFVLASPFSPASGCVKSILNKIVVNAPRSLY